MKYLRKFNENSNSEYVDLVLSERETYNTFNSLKRMWSNVSEDILAVVTLIIGDLNDCDELLNFYREYEMEGSDHALEDAILEFFRSDSWQLSDFAGSYPGIIDGEYLMKRIG